MGAHPLRLPRVVIFAMTQTFDITGMHCGSCVAKVRDALISVDGVRGVEVSRAPDRARVDADDQVTADALNNAVAQRGDYRLAPAGDAAPEGAQSDTPAESLYPLILIVAYLAGAVLLIALATGTWSPMTLMRHFMAGFFLVFSFFKLLDLPGFVSAFRGYDLIARRSAKFAWAYPFIELALGVAYLLNLAPVATNTVTLGVMAVGAVGVAKALLDRRAIRCACLGTALNLPMTKVTLVEDLTMAAMAATMLLLLLS